MSNECNNVKARPSTIARKISLLETITGYVDAHLTQRITLKEVAAYCGVSVSTVTQLFQKRMGITFHNYVTQRRMKEAKSLILSGMPLEEVGRLIGYMDHSTFYRAFRQTFGLSPREYKRQLRQDACDILQISK